MLIQPNVPLFGLYPLLAKDLGWGGKTNWPDLTTVSLFKAPLVLLGPHVKPPPCGRKVFIQSHLLLVVKVIADIELDIAIMVFFKSSPLIFFLVLLGMSHGANWATPVNLGASTSKDWFGYGPKCCHLPYRWGSNSLVSTGGSQGCVLGSTMRPGSYCTMKCNECSVPSGPSNGVGYYTCTRRGVLKPPRLQCKPGTHLSVVTHSNIVAVAVLSRWTISSLH